MNTAWKIMVGLAAFAMAAQARAVGRLVDLKVFDRTVQRELPVYRHEGRYYVAGQPGHRYQIQLLSREGVRVLGVLSVDGVNVVSGDTADWSQTGYVLDPFTAADIRGWRKSVAEVAEFVFADASRSYAARTGRPDNVGVIGMAIFRARSRPLPMQPMTEEAGRAPVDNMRAEASAPAMAAKVAPAGGPIGTGHGARETSVVSYTDFERASATPDDVITLYYDTRERLIAQGIIPSVERPTAPLPDPFPNHFVPDPR